MKQRKKYNGMKTFKLPEDIDYENKAGFVYIVTNTKENKAYVGMKHFWSKLTVDGKKYKKTIESNWSVYKTSNTFLKSDIKANPDDYIFNILFVCNDEPTLKYMEAKTILALGAMESIWYYNENVQITLRNKIKDIETRVIKLEPQEQ